MTSHFYNNNQKKKCPLWCDTRCWSFKHSRKCYFLLLRSFPTKKKKNNICFVREKKDGRLCPTRRRNARGSLLIVYYLEQLPGRPRPPFFLLPEFCLLPPNCFFLFCVCALGYLNLFWYFWYFFQENAAVRLPTATGMTTWSSRLLEEHTQFFRVSFVSVWQCRKVLVFHWWTEENVVSVCACVLLFYPFKRRRCDVQCLVMLTDTAFLDDAQ